MSTALELYRQWEKSKDADPVCVWILDRGDKAPAKRLTFTNKPYVDKGVGGVCYHHTYPRPRRRINGRKFPMVSSEGMNEITFTSLVIDNPKGEYNNILTEYSIVGNEIQMLYGDRSWSLMETAYPYFFRVQIRGQVLGIAFEKGGRQIRFDLAAIRFDVDKMTSLSGEPTGLGAWFNGPVELVNSAWHRYIMNFYAMRQWKTNIALKDNGVLLTHPDDPMPDYSIVLAPDGIFYGEIDLAAAPIGMVTSDGNNGYAYELFGAVRSAVINASNTGYNIAEFRDMSAEGNIARFLSDTHFFIVNGTTGVFSRWTMGTPDLLSSAAKDAGTYPMYGDVTYVNSVWINPGQTRVYAVGGISGTNYLFLWDFGTAGDPSSLQNFESHNIGAMSALNPIDVRLSDDESKVWILFLDGYIHELDQPIIGDLSSIDDPEISQCFNLYDTTPYGFTVVDGGRRLFMAGGAEAQIHQFDLPNANTIKEVVHTHRGYGHRDTVNWIDPFFIDVFENSFYVFNGSKYINRHTDQPKSWMMEWGTFEHNVYSGKGNVRAGIHYADPVTWGRIISDLLETLHAGYSVNRTGQIVATVIEDPELHEAFEPVFTISFGDFVDSENYIEDGETYLPVERVTGRYKVNFWPQSPDALSGDLDEDEIDELSRSHLEYTKTNALANNVQSDDIYIAGYARLNDSTFQSIVDDKAEFHSVPRFTHFLNIKLSAISLMSGFKLGSIIKVGNDWRHPQFAVGDKMEAIEEKIDWENRVRRIKVIK